ncbi:MAG: hypothetical protein IJP28_01940, partial [Erysipelotrichales bacterium]|nr:hypothetical protein [Erysipelotrichales bacterium]
MKKILYMLLCLFLLVGCTHQTGGNTGSISTPPSITTPINTLKLEDHDQIMQRDFYSIAGEYINPTGETI